MCRCSGWPEGDVRFPGLELHSVSAGIWTLVSWQDRKYSQLLGHLSSLIYFILLFLLLLCFIYFFFFEKGSHEGQAGFELAM